jgi:hypothetical protein
MIAARKSSHCSNAWATSRQGHTSRLRWRACANSLLPAWPPCMARHCAEPILVGYSQRSNKPAVRRRDIDHRLGMHKCGYRSATPGLRAQACFFTLHWCSNLSDQSTYRSQSLDHLGLVAGMFDELGIGDVIDFAHTPCTWVARGESPRILRWRMLLSGLQTSSGPAPVFPAVPERHPKLPRCRRGGWRAGRAWR